RMTVVGLALLLVACTGGAVSPGPTGGTGVASSTTPGAAGALLVESCHSHSVLWYDVASGRSLGQFVRAGSGGLVCPEGQLAMSPGGDLYVASFSPERVEAVTPALVNDQILRFGGRTGTFM